MKKEITVINKRTKEVIADFVAENIEEKVILKKKFDIVVRDIDCENCKNYLGGGICTGNSKNEAVDKTGELKCFE